MSNNHSKPVSLALCSAMVGGLALAGSAFAMQPMAQGYLVSAAETAPTDKAAEGKCGMDKVDTDKDGKVSRAEFTAAHADKAAMFDTIDTSKDGFIDTAEHKAHHEGKCGEGKCGEGKCGADKKTGDAKAAHAEGKCGEGKCGGSL